jgi:hypothetical protein
VHKRWEISSLALSLALLQITLNPLTESCLEVKEGVRRALESSGKRQVRFLVEES